MTSLLDCNSVFMNLFKKDGSNVEVMIKSEYVTKLGVVTSGEQKDFEIAEFGTFILVAVNAYAVGGLAIVTTGELANTAYISNVNLNGGYYNLTSKNNHSISVQMTGADAHFYLVKLY